MNNIGLIDELRNTIVGLQERANRNEKLLRKFQAIERDIILFASVSDIFATVTSGYEELFDVLLATICLFDPEGILYRLADDDLELIDSNRVIFVDTDVELHRVVKKRKTPFLMNYDEAALGFFFPIKKSEIKTVAICPLIRQGVLIGTINVAGVAGRFDTSKSTDFLLFYAEVVAISLENAVNMTYFKQKSEIDGLTGLNNRSHFMRKYQTYMSDFKDSSYLGCLMIDIDKFKVVNDTYGHLAGDLVIKAVANGLRLEIMGDELLSRFGGEEFVILTRGNSVEDIISFAERLRRRIESTPISVSPSEEISVTVSVGVATVMVNSDSNCLIDVDKFVSIADSALYDAKRSGRNKVVKRDCAEI